MCSCGCVACAHVDLHARSLVHFANIAGLAYGRHSPHWSTLAAHATLRAALAEASLDTRRAVFHCALAPFTATQKDGVWLT